MRNPIAYMLTWTTYGSWLQGDERGYVKDGVILYGNKALNTANKALMQYPEVSLTLVQRQTIENALRKEAELLGQEIYAIAVGKNHIHLAVSSNGMDAGVAVSHYKNAARLKIKDDGFIRRLWTRGFSKRYCFDEHQLQTVIAYVNNHNKKNGRLKPPT
jgi:REP element-mobilizing transposase RayT